MPDLRELLSSCGLARIAQRVEAARKPSIYLTAETSSDLAVSRLGGTPNLPSGHDWPEWRGRALPFVAQLDLAGFPGIGAIGLPSQGCLYFFYEGGYDAWGFDPAHAGCSKVIYEPDARLSDSPARPIPKSVPNEFRFLPANLQTSSAGTSVPDCEDPIVEEFSFTSDELRAYIDFLEKWRESMPPTFHRLGGYPEQVQGDPKLEAHLVSQGINCGDGRGYEEARKKGLFDGAADWELLFQVDSEESAGMMWGDAGRLYFLIRKQDLEQRLFDRTWLILQCY